MAKVFSAEVRDLSHKGLGVVDHPDGRTFYVRNTWPGDVGEFEIDEGAPKYTEARLLQITWRSKDRKEITCRHRGSLPGQCGGCPWMLASYPSQLEFKVRRLRHALVRRGLDLENVLFKDVIPSPDIFGYRNRVQLKTDGSRLGFVSENSRVFAPVDDCLIMNERLQELFQDLRRSIPREEFLPGEGHTWAYVDLDDLMTSEDIIPNRRRPFRQGNTKQNVVMKEWVRRAFEPLPRHFPVIDLFCGSGNFTEVLSQLGFANILAVEVQGCALEELRAKKLPGVRIMSLDMTSRGSWAQIAKAQPHAKALLVDPPREGLQKRRGLYKYLDNLELITYISCESDTYSRDAADLVKNSWRLDELTPIDLFPHTPHVEILSAFRKVTNN